MVPAVGENGNQLMEPSPDCIALVKESEGFRSKPYVDAAGFQTVGYGHKILPHEDFSAGITLNQAEAICIDDLNRAADQVDALVKVPLTQGQFDALCDFVFNLGSGRLEHSTLLELLNERKYDEAGEQMFLWVKAGKKILPGLVIRRQKEVELWGKA